MHWWVTILNFEPHKAVLLCYTCFDDNFWHLYNVLISVVDYIGFRSTLTGFCHWQALPSRIIWTSCFRFLHFVRRLISSWLNEKNLLKCSRTVSECESDFYTHRCKYFTLFNCNTHILIDVNNFSEKNCNIFSTLPIFDMI